MIKFSVASKVAAGVGLIAAVGLASAAQAQDRFEANTRGYFGGYSSFGGYYDTFGGYGGQYSYGYRRYNQVYSPTATLLAIPVQGPSEAQESCGWLKQQAKATGSRKWRARYAACRSGN